MRTLADGPVERGLFERAGIRVVHLLKQGVTAQLQRGLSLPEQIRNDYPYLQRKWKVSALRTLGIMAGLPPFGFVRRASPEKVLWPAFRRSAVVNLVKVTGRTRIGRAELRTLAARASEVTERQVRELRPDIILCGGTYDVVAEFWFPNSDMWERDYYMSWGTTLFVRARHPASMCTFKEQYDEVRGALVAMSTSKNTASWWPALLRRARARDAFCREESMHWRGGRSSGISKTRSC